MAENSAVKHPSRNGHISPKPGRPHCTKRCCPLAAENSAINQRRIERVLMPPALAIFRPRFPNKLGNGGGCIAQYDGCPCSCRVYVTYMNHRTRRVHRALLSVPTCGHDRTLILVIFQNTAVEGAQRAFAPLELSLPAYEKSAEPTKTRLCAHSV